MGIVYDAAGREASRTGDFGAVGFTYSDAGRLTGVDASGTTGDSASAYSAAGNLETQTVDTSTTVMSYEADSQRLVNRRVDGSVVATYTFDGLGQRIAQGPTSNKTAEVFGYTGTGRLASYTTSSGTSAAYSFDANGQRTRSEVRSDDVTATTDWTYEGLQLLALSASRSDGTTWAITYLYDSGGKPYAGVYRASDEETSTPFLMITNHRGDVLALTDTAGQRFASWTYDEWGVITTSTTEATGSITDSLAADIASRQPLRYAGYCYDTETKMYYCSARTYDPLTRQFLSKDPAKADGEESAYQYCSGNPVEKVDPTGCVVTYASAGWDDRKRFAVRGRLENLLPTEGMPSTLWVAFAAHVNIYYALLGPRVQGIKADWRKNGVWMYDTSTKKFCVRGMLNYLPMRPTTCFFYSGAVRLESWYEASGEWNRMESRNDYNPSKGVWYSYVRTSPWLRKCPTRVRVRITLTTIDGLGDVSETHRDTISKPSGVI
jgi:RHS repeat-associated protein